ncbi:MAG TPA: histidinol-phosphate transaminase [Chroococcales cyanobacterium]
MEVARRLVPEFIEKLVPYRPGKPIEEVQRELGIQQVIKLASNENPLGVSSEVPPAILEAMASIHRYPDAGGLVLRRAIADKYCTKVENVILGSGSEGIMGNIARTFLHDDDEALTSEGTFVGFHIIVRSQGIKVRTVPLQRYAFDLGRMAEAIDSKTKIIYLANPNNPTGTIFDHAAFESFINQVPPHVLVLADEAYFEYTRRSEVFPDSMTYRYDNVITLRTFSKAYGLAGLRLGYGLAHESLISHLLKVKLPFEPNSLAQAAGLAALRDQDFVEKTVALNEREKDGIYEALEKLGLNFVPSHTNFVLVEMGDEKIVDRISSELLSSGVVIRPLRSFGLPTCFRITIGLPAENDFLIERLREAVS